MKTVAEYLDLITQQHRDKPRFMATVEAMVTPYVHMQNVIMSFLSAFDVDSAIGVQLDIIGQWVGVSRIISTPISGVYFNWDGTSQTGWDNGVWKSANDPDSGFTNLPDSLYRLVIKAKIASNASCGEVSDIYNILTSVVSVDSAVKIVDNQNMTMTVQLDVSELTSYEQQIIRSGVLNIQTAGVSVLYEDV